MSKTIIVRDYVYKKVRGLNKNLIKPTLPEYIQPEDLGKLEALHHAEMILDDFVPSSNKNKKKWD